MCRTILILGMCVFLSSCFANIKNSTGAESDISSINISKPENLSNDYSNGGYTLCLERQNPKESTCTKSVIKENPWSASTINEVLQNNCPSGYKLKMWLWKDKDNTKNPDNVYVLNVNNTQGGKQYDKDGFVLIGKNKLTGSNIDLKLSFVRLNSDLSDGSSPDVVGVEVSAGFDDGSTNANTTAKSSSNFNFSCSDGSNETYTPSSSGGGSSSKGGSGSSGTNNLDYLKSMPTIKSGLPSVIQFAGKNCSPCKEEKRYWEKNLSKLDEKMNIYIVDTVYVSNNQYCSTDSIPVTVFFDKEGNQSGNCISGLAISTFITKVKELTGVVTSK